VLVALVGAGHAHAQDGLAALETGLASDVASERRAAIAGYDALSAADVPAMRERLDALRRPVIATDEVNRIVTALRHAVGSRRADDLVDIAPGAPTLLDTERTRPVVRLVAALLIERAAERIDTTESLALVPELLRFGGDAMRLEGRRITMRLDARLSAAVITSLSHGDREVRVWAEWSAERLGTGEPGRYVAELEPALVPDVLRAYARARIMGGVPVAISFVAAERRGLREAAREALTTYGQSSIWVAREAYRLRTGEDASRDWGWRRTLDELFSVIDAARQQAAEPALARAEQALASHDRAAAHAALDEALRALPSPSDPRAGGIALDLVEQDLDANDRAGAALALARAERLPIDPSRVARRTALRAYLTAGDHLEAGVLDADAFRAAASADPTCERCVRDAAPLIEPGPETASGRGTLPIWLAAAAFLALAVLLLPETRGSSSAPPPSSAPPAPPTDDPADATLG
jgi:hypothetical protein